MRTPLRVVRPQAAEILLAAIRKESRAVNLVRIRAVLAVTRGAHVPAVARMFAMAERAVRNWVHRFNVDGMPGLLDARAGRRCRLSPEQQEELRQRIRAGPVPEDGVCSLRGRDIRRILREEYRVTYARSSVYHLLHHQLGMSYLKPRPIHRKADPDAQEAFKKTSPKSSRKSVKSSRSEPSRSGSRTRADSVNKAR